MINRMSSTSYCDGSIHPWRRISSWRVRLPRTCFVSIAHLSRIMFRSSSLTVHVSLFCVSVMYVAVSNLIGRVILLFNNVAHLDLLPRAYRLQELASSFVPLSRRLGRRWAIICRKSLPRCLCETDACHPPLYLLLSSYQIYNMIYFCNFCLGFPLCSFSLLPFLAVLASLIPVLRLIVIIIIS